MIGIIVAPIDGESRVEKFERKKARGSKKMKV